MISKILNELFEYSNHYINIREDKDLPYPGFSTIEKDIYGRYIPVILINKQHIPTDDNIFAHVLAHEWGHHVLRHIKHDPPPMNLRPSQLEVQKKEHEADEYAAKFVQKYNYNKEIIASFMKKHPFDLDNRLAILFK